MAFVCNETFSKIYIRPRPTYITFSSATMFCFFQARLRAWMYSSCDLTIYLYSFGIIHISVYFTRILIKNQYNHRPICTIAFSYNMLLTFVINALQNVTWYLLLWRLCRHSVKHNKMASYKRVKVGA